MMFKKLLKEVEENQFYKQAILLARNEEEKKKISEQVINLVHILSPVLERLETVVKDPKLSEEFVEGLKKMKTENPGE